VYVGSLKSEICFGRTNRWLVAIRRFELGRLQTSIVRPASHPLPFDIDDRKSAFVFVLPIFDNIRLLENAGNASAWQHVGNGIYRDGELVSVEGVKWRRGWDSFLSVFSPSAI
jgi:hypothetical protein